MNNIRWHSLPKSIRSCSMLDAVKIGNKLHLVRFSIRATQSLGVFTPKTVHKAIVVREISKSQYDTIKSFWAMLPTIRKTQTIRPFREKVNRCHVQPGWESDMGRFHPTVDKCWKNAYLTQYRASMLSIYHAAIAEVNLVINNYLSESDYNEQQKAVKVLTPAAELLGIPLSSLLLLAKRKSTQNVFSNRL